MSSKPLFTVFTPTYNRVRTLPRVYDSLLAQTCEDFEWLVIDDGSTDATADRVQAWQRDPRTWFPIRYIWQKNQHKKIAHNHGVREARGELFLTLDSDDRCVAQALERLAYHWYRIPKTMRPRYCAVTALCMDEAGEVVGDRFPASHWLDSDSLELRYRYAVSGEKWGFQRTDILKRFPYPEKIDGHVPESTVWMQIATRYKTRFINEALRVYHHDPYATTGQISKAGMAAGMPGHLYWKWAVLSNAMGYFRYRPAELSLDAARLTRFYLHSPAAQRFVYWPDSVAGMLLTTLMMPMGWLWWLADRSRARKASMPRRGLRRDSDDSRQ